MESEDKLQKQPMDFYNMSDFLRGQSSKLITKLSDEDRTAFVLKNGKPIVYCGHCGDIYRRVHWNNRGYKSIVWRCVSRLEEKGSECTAPTINEETLQTAVVKAINELLANKEPFLSTLQKNIATIFNEENDNATDDIDSKLEELQQQLLIQAKSKNDYEDVADEIYRLRELKQNALVENVEREGKRQRIAEMTDFLNEQSAKLEEYDEQLVRRLIEKVTIHDDRIEVEFKSGVEIDIET